MDAIPLRIDWAIATPWCPPAMGLHLDGLIGYAVVQEAERDGREFSSHDELLTDLPFAKHEVDGDWCWKASLLAPVNVLGSERIYMTAKTASQSMAEAMVDGKITGRKIKSIDTVRGLFKNDAFWYTIEHVDKIQAWCVGDPERITELLSLITHIGKRARLDHGRIAMRDQSEDDEGGLAFDVVEDAQALELWKRRYVPMAVEGYVPVQARVRPPYWQGEGARVCWRPA